MARPRGGKLTEHASKTVAVRYPLDLLVAIEEAAGREEVSLATWLRHVARIATGRRLDHVAGYEEGFAAGWADSKTKFQQGAAKAAR